MSGRICVYCGSNPGHDARHVELARSLAREMVARDIGLVYGGGRVGMMGTLADEVLECGGAAVGVIPRDLMAREVAHDGLTELHVVESMHERKALMADLASGFVALPGGLGTLEELFEILTWAQLGIHEDPCGILNTTAYFDSLIAFLEHAVGEGFLKPEHRDLLLVDDDPARLLDRFAEYRPPHLTKWLRRETT